MHIPSQRTWRRIDEVVRSDQPLQFTAITGELGAGQWVLKDEVEFEDNDVESDLNQRTLNPKTESKAAPPQQQVVVNKSTAIKNEASKKAIRLKATVGFIPFRWVLVKMLVLLVDFLLITSGIFMSWFGAVKFGLWTSGDSVALESVVEFIEFATQHPFFTTGFLYGLFLLYLVIFRIFFGKTIAESLVTKPNE